MRKIILLFLFPLLAFSQVNLPSVPGTSPFQQYGMPSFENKAKVQVPNTTNTSFGSAQQQKSNQQLIQEIEKREIDDQKIKQEIHHDIATSNASFNYSLPSFSFLPATQYYYEPVVHY